MRLRVLTWNVQNEQGDRRRLGLINREIRRLDPDVVTLQEVVRLADLLDGTGLHATHQADVLEQPPPLADRYGGTVVATRRPHRIAGVVEERSRDVHHWTLAVACDIPGAGEQLVIAPTTPWQFDAEADRERQAVEIADLDRKHRGPLPTIIAGDFNAGPDAASIRFLSGLQGLNGRGAHYHDAWAVAGEGPGHTWSADNRLAAAEIARIVGQPGHRRRIDYVFVGSAQAHPGAPARIVSARLVGAGPVDGVWLSDHAGLVVDLDLTTPAGADPAQEAETTSARADRGREARADPDQAIGA